MEALLANEKEYDRNKFLFVCLFAWGRSYEGEVFGRNEQKQAKGTFEIAEEVKEKKEWV